jgi:hypothetical protein
VGLLKELDDKAGMAGFGAKELWASRGWANWIWPAAGLRGGELSAPRNGGEGSACAMEKLQAGRIKKTGSDAMDGGEGCCAGRADRGEWAPELQHGSSSAMGRCRGNSPRGRGRKQWRSQGASMAGNKGARPCGSSDGVHGEGRGHQGSMGEQEQREEDGRRGARSRCPDGVHDRGGASRDARRPWGPPAQRSSEGEAKSQGKLQGRVCGAMGEGGDPLLAVVWEKEKLHGRDGWEKKEGWRLVDLTRHLWHPIGHRRRQHLLAGCSCREGEGDRERSGCLDDLTGRCWQLLAQDLVASHWTGAGSGRLCQEWGEGEMACAGKWRERGCN